MYLLTRQIPRGLRRQKMITIPQKAEIVTSYIGEDYDVTIYSTGGVTHYVHVCHIDTGKGAVRKFRSRAKAAEFADLQAKQKAY